MASRHDTRGAAGAQASRWTWCHLLQRGPVSHCIRGRRAPEVNRGTRRATTVNDIARAAGVSRATVSRVLNQPTVVAPDRRERVLEAIRTFRYQPNRLARGLRSGRSGTSSGSRRVRAGATLEPLPPPPASSSREGAKRAICSAVGRHASVLGTLRRSSQHLTSGVVGDRPGNRQTPERLRPCERSAPRPGRRLSCSGPIKPIA